MNSQKTHREPSKWSRWDESVHLKGQSKKVYQTDAEAVKRRRKIEETIEARRMLNEMGILL